LSIEATVWALKYAPPMPPQLLGTLFGLADHADKKGEGAYPSVRTLAAYACKSERSVQRDLKELVKLGLIRAGDQKAAAHIPAERRPYVYDLVMELTVPGGRAGDDAVTSASRVTLASSRARGGRKAAAHAKGGVTPTSGGDAHVTGDADVTSGVTPTSEWGDAHVATGVTPTSPKPSYEPPTNRPMNQEGVQTVTTHLTAVAERDAFGPSPIDIDGWTLTDGLRRWAHRDGYAALVDLDYETAQFLDHFRGNASRRPNWNTEWQKWIRRAHKWATERGRTSNVVALPTGQTLTGTDARVYGWLNLPSDEQEIS
jgi:hypothetical protein